MGGKGLAGWTGQREPHRGIRPLVSRGTAGHQRRQMAEDGARLFQSEAKLGQGTRQGRQPRAGGGRAEDGTEPRDKLGVKSGNAPRRRQAPRAAETNPRALPGAPSPALSSIQRLSSKHHAEVKAARLGDHRERGHEGGVRIAGPQAASSSTHPAGPTGWRPGGLIGVATSNRQHLHFNSY